MTFPAILYVPEQPKIVDNPRCLLSSMRYAARKGFGSLIRENAVDPAPQSEVEILARSTKKAQIFPATGVTAIAVAAVLAPAGPCGAGKVDGVRGGVHVCGSDTERTGVSGCLEPFG